MISFTSSAEKPPSTRAARTCMPNSSHRHEGAEDDPPPGALVEMPSLPPLAPGAAGDEILSLGIDRVAAGLRAVAPGIAQNLAAGGRPAPITLLVVHGSAHR